MSEPRRATATSFSTHQQKKQFLLASLLLALRNSEVARVVDIGTLEYFLDSSYPQMVRGDSIDLTRLWDVLVAEPGIEEPMIFPPLLAYKSWEERLGVTVFLPYSFKELTPEDRRLHEGRCSIRASELEHLLTERKIAPPRKPARTSALRQRESSARAVVSSHWLIHPARVALAAAIGLAVVIAFGTYIGLRPKGVSRFDLTVLRSDLALRDGKQNGESLSAVIEDPRFAHMSITERSQKVAAAFASAKRMGIKTLLLLDQDGNIKSIAQQSGQTDKISVMP